MARSGDIAFTREDTIRALAQAVKSEPKEAENLKDINRLWIDVNVRTPSKDECERMDGRFLVCRSDGKLYIDSYLYEGNGYSAKGFYVKDSTEVIAWMNLPDPFGKETTI